MSAQTSPTRFRFGLFELDFDKQILTKGGCRCRLQPQPWKALELLVRHAGSLVTREELQEHLWGDRAVDAEKGLNFTVRQIRRVLGDSADAPIYIETVPRRGYRFIAPVETHEKEEVADQPPLTPAGRRTVLPWVVGILGPLVLLIGTGLWVWSRNSEPVDQRLAVLPFELRGTGLQEGLVAEGFTEDLMMALGRLDPERIELVSLEASRAFSQEERALSELRRALEVHLVVRGSIQAAADGTRIQVWLERTEDQSLLWTDRYELPEGALVGPQKEVAKRTVVAVARTLGVGLRPSGLRIEKPGEREAYLRGQYLLAKGGSEDARQSIEYFEEAVTIDPGSARAYAALAEAVLRSGGRPDWISRRAGTAAQRAVALDPEMAGAYVTLSWIAAAYDWDWEAADRYLHQALKQESDSFMAHDLMAFYLLRAGQFESALKAARRALELNPVSSLANNDLGWAFFYCRRFEEAAEQCRRTLDLEPDQSSAWVCLLHSLLRLERIDEAVAVAGEMKRRMDAEGRDLESSTADPSEAMGRFWRWRQDRQRRRLSHGYAPRDGLVDAALQLGDREEALHHLRSAFAERSSFMIFVGVDPRFDALRGDPVFEDLLIRIERGEPPLKAVDQESPATGGRGRSSSFQTNSP